MPRRRPGPNVAGGGFGGTRLGSRPPLAALIRLPQAERVLPRYSRLFPFPMEASRVSRPPSFFFFGPFSSLAVGFAAPVFSGNCPQEIGPCPGRQQPPGGWFAGARSSCRECFRKGEVVQLLLLHLKCCDSLGTRATTSVLGRLFEPGEPMVELVPTRPRPQGCLGKERCWFRAVSRERTSVCPRLRSN